MPHPLVTQIATPNDAVYGVNVLNVAAPVALSGVSTNRIAVVANLPWGPLNEVVTVRSAAEFRERFYPAEFGSVDDTTYPAMRALLRKVLFNSAGLQVLRIDATDAVAASYTFDDTTPTDSVTVTAKYQGALGNSIKVAWSANAVTSGNRDATVSIGSRYSKLYKNVVTAAGVLTDPGDPFVTFAKHASYAAVPAVIAATNLASGVNGTAVAADYTGTIGSSGTGLDTFGAESVDFDVLFCAEVPSALCNTVNAALVSFQTSYAKGLCVLSTPDGQSASTATTYVATYESTRCVYAWPRVLVVNDYDADLDTVEVDGNAFMAALIGNVDPWISPGGAGKRVGTTDLLSGIVGLETANTSKATAEAMLDAGITVFGLAPASGSGLRGAYARSCVATSHDPDVPALIQVQRIRDYLNSSIASYATNYVSLPLDLDLITQRLGPNTEGLYAAIKNFLKGEQDAGHIKAASVDPFSENTEGTLDTGVWTIQIVVETYAPGDKIILSSQIGPTVTVG